MKPTGAPAEEILRILGTALGHLPPGTEPFEILVFGSGALTLTILPSRVSVDVDIAVERSDRYDLLRGAVAAAGLTKKDGVPVYIDVNDVFYRTAPRNWRARILRRIDLPQGHRIVIPDPLDILVTKVCRYDAKDIADTRDAFAAIGAPPLETMRDRFREAVEIYRPPFDEEADRSDPWHNTVRFFADFYRKTIDRDWIRKEIVIPALAALREELDPPAPPLRPRPKKKKRRTSR